MESYASVWEFRVKPHAVAEFERHYGRDGTWALLFKRSSGYLGTILLKDTSEPLRYITIDRWRSVEDYSEFRARYVSEYGVLDERCEALTTHEAALGELTEIT